MKAFEAKDLEKWIKENPEETVLKIPEEFDTITKNSFSDVIENSKIKKIFCSKNIVEIQSRSFVKLSFYPLDSIHFASDAEVNIQDGAFYRCSAKYISLPEKCKIGAKAFEACYWLKNIYIPENAVIEDATKLFYDCTHLKHCTIQCKLNNAMNMSQMFTGCDWLGELYFSNIELTKENFFQMDKPRSSYFKIRCWTEKMQALISEWETKRKKDKESAEWHEKHHKINDKKLRKIQEITNKKLIKRKFKKIIEKFGYKFWLNNYTYEPHVIIKLSEDEFLFCKEPNIMIYESNDETEIYHGVAETYIKELNSLLSYTLKQQTDSKPIDDDFIKENNYFSFLRIYEEEVKPIKKDNSSLKFFKNWDWSKLNGNHESSSKYKLDIVPLNEKLFITKRKILSPKINFSKNMQNYFDKLKKTLPLCKTDFEVLDCILNSDLLAWFRNLDCDVYPKEPVYPSSNNFNNDYDYREAVKKYRVEYQNWRKRYEGQIFQLKKENTEIIKNWENLYESYMDFVIRKNRNISYKKTDTNEEFLIKFSDDFYFSYRLLSQRYYSDKKTECQTRKIDCLAFLAEVIKLSEIIKKQTSKNVICAILSTIYQPNFYRGEWHYLDKSRF